MYDQLVRSALPAAAAYAMFASPQLHAQTTPAVLAVHGRMATDANITDKFVFQVPANTSRLTIRVPVPDLAGSPSRNASPLGEGETVGDVTVTATQQPDSQNEQRDSSGNLYRVLSYDHVDPGMLTVSSTLSDVRTDADLNTPLPVAGYPLRWVPSGAQRYLDSTRLVQSDDMRIVLLSRRIVAGCSSESGAAKAIAAWLQRRLSYSINGNSAYRTDAISTLARGGGVCEGWAHLFLALARAGGIPCRYVAGYCIGGSISYPISAIGDGYGVNVSVSMPSLPHAWVEVWYPGAGWVAYDPQSSAGFVDSHHVPVWTGLDGNSSLPILTWESTSGTGSCSFAEQEFAKTLSDTDDLRCDGDLASYRDGRTMLLTR